jgi:hypothetical protein
MADREPVSSKYCKEVNCQLRQGNKCTVSECTRKGAEKWVFYFIEHNHLADGDTPDA